LRANRSFRACCWLDALLLAALLLTPAAKARAQDVPPAWRGAWDFLVENVCVDSRGRVLPGTSPFDEPTVCPHQRKLGVGERLPYHKRDWAGTGDRETHPGGYQQSDAFPVQTSLGPAVVQTYDFGGSPRAFGQFDQGDGGQVAFFSATTASFGITEDGGAGLQFFFGPGCQPLDSWVIVDKDFVTQAAGETLARITRRLKACPARLGSAFTRWHMQPVSYRYTVHGRPARVTEPTLVSEHFGGRDVGGADHLERMYFTRQLGYTRWERWQNLAVHDRAADRRQAGALAASDRCEAGLGAPVASANWVMVDCREWTQIAPPMDSAGDPPSFWVDRLRGYPETKAIFTP
jgi:hypothetical protein